MKIRIFVLLLVTVCVGFCLVSGAQAQRRDHLTAEEIELVRDVQDVDERMELFAKAIERRLLVISGPDKLSADQLEQLEKDNKKWGELPKGSRIELLSDIEKILNEAIDKLEDVFDREPQNELIPFALYAIADYSEVLIAKLQTLALGIDNTRELGLLEKAGVHCQNILDARENVPRPTGKRSKKKKTK